MEHELTPDGQEAIERLSYEIAMRRRLDFDGRKEIAGHIEDKVLGYLDGEESLTEEDALLLAREHFGERMTQPVFERSNVKDEFVGLFRALVIGVLPYGISLFLVCGFFNTIAHWADVNLMKRPETANSIAWIVGFFMVLLLTVALTPGVRRRSEKWSGKKLVFISGFVFILVMSIFDLGKFYTANLKLVNDFLLGVENQHPWVSVSLLIAFISSIYVCHGVVGYQFIRWQSRHFSAVGAIVGMVFWVAAHVVGFFSIGAFNFLVQKPSSSYEGAFWMVPWSQNYYQTAHDMGYIHRNDATNVVFSAIENALTQGAIGPFFVIPYFSVLTAGILAFLWWGTVNRNDPIEKFTITPA